MSHLYFIFLPQLLWGFYSEICIRSLQYHFTLIHSSFYSPSDDFSYAPTLVISKRYFMLLSNNVKYKRHQQLLRGKKTKTQILRNCWFCPTRLYQTRAFGDYCSHFCFVCVCFLTIPTEKVAEYLM